MEIYPFCHTGFIVLNSENPEFKRGELIHLYWQKYSKLAEWGKEETKEGVTTLGLGHFCFKDSDDYYNNLDDIVLDKLKALGYSSLHDEYLDIVKEDRYRMCLMFAAEDSRAAGAYVQYTSKAKKNKKISFEELIKEIKDNAYAPEPNNLINEKTDLEIFNDFKEGNKEVLHAWMMYPKAYQGFFSKWFKNSSVEEPDWEVWIEEFDEKYGVSVEIQDDLEVPEKIEKQYDNKETFRKAFFKKYIFWLKTKDRKDLDFPREETRPKTGFKDITGTEIRHNDEVKISYKSGKEYMDPEYRRVAFDSEKGWIVKCKKWDHKMSDKWNYLAG